MTKIHNGCIINAALAKKSLVMPFYYINFDQNGPPYDSVLHQKQRNKMKSENPLWLGYEEVITIRISLLRNFHSV